MMRILHITPAFQHPAVRGPHRHYHFLRELSERHSVTWLTLIRADVGDDALREIGAYADGVYAFDVNGRTPKPMAGLLGEVPMVGARLERDLKVRGGLAQMRQAFRRLARPDRFDVVLFHGKSVFPVVAGYRDLPVVVDFCDATSMRIQQRLGEAGPWRRWLLALRYAQVRRTEQRLLGLTPHRAFISPRDRAAVLGRADGSPIVPNGVDLAYWQRRGAAWDGPPRLVFTGVMDYQPNADAAMVLIDRVLPLVRARVPEAEVVIVGRDPPPALVERGRTVRGVAVTGFVEDMRPYLEQATAMAAPLRYASGTQNKILEAMAMAVPVVTTHVAADGLKIDTVEPPVLTAADDAAFAAAVVGLIRDAAARDRLAEASRRYVEERFDWGRSAARLEEMCQTAIEERKR